jgi:aspartate racemase
MKTLGLMGGMSWISTVEYYRLINEGVNAKLGGNHAARLALYSVNFADIAEIVAAGDWDRFLDMAIKACKGLKAQGAEAIVLCANTAHIVADRLKPKLDIPLIHLVDAVAEDIKKSGMDNIGLLGTRFTMEADFFKDRLKKHGIASVIPGKADRDFIHASIFEELGKGIFKPATKQRYQDIIGGLANGGSQAAVLACTEIPMIIKEYDVSVPVYDTTAIHANAAVNFALS